MGVCRRGLSERGVAHELDVLPSDGNIAPRPAAPRDTSTVEPLPGHQFAVDDRGPGDVRKEMITQRRAYIPRGRQPMQRWGVEVYIPRVLPLGASSVRMTGL